MDTTAAAYKGSTRRRLSVDDDVLQQRLRCGHARLFHIFLRSLRLAGFIHGLFSDDRWDAFRIDRGNCSLGGDEELSGLFTTFAVTAEAPGARMAAPVTEPLLLLRIGERSPAVVMR